MKSNIFPRFILKLESKDIINSDFNYAITLNEAKHKDGIEVISISDSQVIRWIDKKNGYDRDKAKKEYDSLHTKIKRNKRTKDGIKQLYNRLDELQFIPELINVVMSKDKDIDLLDDGFYVNGVYYTRFVGSPNQVKKRTVTYSSITNYLNEKSDNGRNKDVKMVVAKFEAYKALNMSGSFPVTNTEKILVVDDLTTTFEEDVIVLSEEGEEPTYTEERRTIELDESDGYGLISPEQAQIWSNDMHLDYLISGCCVRHAFTKGMVAVFDFKEFAREHGKRFVKDVWGKEHDIFDIDIVLTTSMLKLWSSYDSIDSFIENSKKNDFSFSVTKITSSKFDEVRTLNYQFIQSYDLSDDDIKELYSPTISEIKDVIHGDINKSILFLKGIGVTDDNATIGEDDFVKAMMIEDSMVDDPYVIDRINCLIKKKIKDAKIGVLKVNGNYGIVVGDPYALCQHMFGLDVKNEEYGLLKAGEIYHKFWKDKGVDEVVMFRAPMSCHNNIRKVKIADSEEMNKWYKYCEGLIMLNAHDSICHSLNGMDKDSDISFSTNNSVLLNKWVKTPAIICPQKSAEKNVVTQDGLREANKNAFGSKVGAITNRVTSMFDMLPLFPKGSVEYEALQYRIKCGQLYQQNDIDSTKGIVAKPMPKYWYTKIKPKKDEELSEEDIFNNSICVDKKPYFMRYIYEEENKKYTQYKTNAIKECRRLLGCELDTILSVDYDTLSEEEKEYRDKYIKYMPLNDNGCVMNRLCHAIEKEFENYTASVKASNHFDYNILKTPNVNYDANLFKSMVEIYLEYMSQRASCVAEHRNKRMTKEDFSSSLNLISEEYKRKCKEICPNEEVLCNVVLDICYTNSKSKSFAWEMCGRQIIKNLLKKNDYKINYLVKSSDGEIEYSGYKFERRTINVDNE